MDRKDVYELIDGERDYQDALGNDRTDGKVRSICEELVLLQVYIQRALEVWTDTPGDIETREMVRKVGAIAVRCMENYPTPPRARGRTQTDIYMALHL